LISRAMKLAHMAEQGPIGNDEPRNHMADESPDAGKRRRQKAGQNDNFSRTDCPFHQFGTRSRLVMEFCRRRSHRHDRDAKYR
jgi:hypothetical protein